MMPNIFLFIAAFLFTGKLFGQNVGIGTSTPTYPLTVISQGNRGITQKSGDVEVGFYTNATGAFLQTWSSHPLYFSTGNGSSYLSILTNGQIGVGTTNPTTRLDVNGQMRIRGGNPENGRVLTAIDANGNAEWRVPGASTKQLNISFASFFPMNSNLGWVNDNIGRQPASAVAGITYFEAPLLLPAGTKLISIDWLFIDNDAKNFEFCVVYDDNYSSNPGNGVVTLGCTSSNVTTPFGQSLNRALNSHIMENTPYYLRVGVVDWPTNNRMMIKGARITYE